MKWKKSQSRSRNIFLLKDLAISLQNVKRRSVTDTLGSPALYKRFFTLSSICTDVNSSRNALNALKPIIAQDSGNAFGSGTKWSLIWFTFSVLIVLGDRGWDATTIKKKSWCKKKNKHLLTYQKFEPRSINFQHFMNNLIKNKTQEKHLEASVECIWVLTCKNKW